VSHDLNHHPHVFFKEDRDNTVTNFDVVGSTLEHHTNGSSSSVFLDTPISFMDTTISFMDMPISFIDTPISFSVSEPSESRSSNLYSANEDLQDDTSTTDPAGFLNQYSVYDCHLGLGCDDLSVCDGDGWQQSIEEQEIVNLASDVDDFAETETSVESHDVSIMVGLEDVVVDNHQLTVLHGLDSDLVSVHLTLDVSLSSKGKQVILVIFLLS